MGAGDFDDAEGEKRTMGALYTDEGVEALARRGWSATIRQS